MVDREITSLVPRLFPLPDFDHLQYAKKQGEAWDKLSRE